MKLGDRELSRIGLGTNRLTNTPANVAFVRAAVDAGVQMIDTAFVYTGGESEQAIGEALSLDSGSFVVATKGGEGGAGQGRRDALHAEIELSLKRLKTDRIALYYLHRIDPETAIEESLAAIKEYQDRGTIQYVGLSQVGIEEIERARRFTRIVAVQNQYNIVQRTSEPVVDYCTREGLVFFPFHPIRPEPPSLAIEIATRRGVTPQQIMLAWLLRRSPAILAIPGTLSLDHLRQNLKAATIELTDREFKALSD